MATLFRFIFRLSLLALGLVFAACLLLLMVIGFVLWSARAVWFKLTGQAVKPFVMRMNPRAGFGQVYRAAGFRARSGTRSAPSGDIVDAEVKVIKTSY